MKVSEAIAIACETLEIRRDQWQGVAVPDHCLDGDPSDLIPELFEADPEEARQIADRLEEARAILQKMWQIT
jgi:hypothetical protein